MLATRLVFVAMLVYMLTLLGIAFYIDSKRERGRELRESFYYQDGLKTIPIESKGTYTGGRK